MLWVRSVWSPVCSGKGTARIIVGTLYWMYLITSDVRTTLVASECIPIHSSNKFNLILNRFKLKPISIDYTSVNLILPVLRDAIDRKWHITDVTVGTGHVRTTKLSVGWIIIIPLWLGYRNQLIRRHFLWSISKLHFPHGQQTIFVFGFSQSRIKTISTS
jgi:hypothetical protein